MQRILAPARVILRNRAFLELLGCNVLLGFAYSFVLPFYSMFGTIEVGMSSWVFGVFMTLTAVSATAISTALARWSDTRFTRRAMLLLGSGCGALGYLGFAFVRDFAGLLVIGCGVLGVASITFSQLFAYARELLGRSAVPASEAPLYMNVFRLAFALSWTVGPALAASVMAVWSYEGLFVAAAACFVLLFAAVCWCVPNTPPTEAAIAAARVPLLRTLARPDLLATFTAFVFVFAAGTMSMMNLPLLLTNTLGGTPRDVGVAFAVAPVFELPFMVYFGLLASKGDQSPIIRAGVFLAVIYYVWLTLVAAPWHVYPAQVLSAAVTSVTSGVAITFFQNFLPDQPGTATNLYSSSSRIGAMVGYLLFGSVAAALGYRGVYVACTLLTALALLILAAFRRVRVPAPVVA